MSKNLIIIAEDAFFQTSNFDQVKTFLHLPVECDYHYPSNLSVLTIRKYDSVYYFLNSLLFIMQWEVLNKYVWLHALSAVVEII